MARNTCVSTVAQAGVGAVSFSPMGTFITTWHRRKAEERTLYPTLVAAVAVAVVAAIVAAIVVAVVVAVAAVVSETTRVPGVAFVVAVVVVSKTAFMLCVHS